MELAIAIWIICGILAGVIANERGGNGVLAFIVGLLLGPLGVVLSWFMGGHEDKVDRQVKSGAMKRCSRCAEAVLPAALVCKHCGHEFSIT